jgi:hypothetical protein
MNGLARVGAMVALAVCAAGCGGTELYDHFSGGGTGGPTQPPSSGLFYNDNTDGDYRGRSEHIYDVGIDFRGLPTATPWGHETIRMVARQAALVIEVPVAQGEAGAPDRDATAARAAEAAATTVAIAKELTGWVVYHSPNRVIVRVPAATLDTALKRISALGEVVAQSVESEDVTDRYRDNATRLDNLQRTRQRYVQLLAMAADVRTKLRLEKEYQRVTLELARIEGAQKALEDSVQFSIIDVAFGGAYRPAPGPRPGPLGWVFVGLWTSVRWLFVWY